MKQMLLLLIIVLLTACTPMTPPDGEGYILEVSDGSILVIDAQILDKSWNDIFEEYTGSAIQLSTRKKNLKPGQRIRYWVNGGVNDSYPSQAEAKRIEVID